MRHARIWKAVYLILMTAALVNCRGKEAESTWTTNQGPQESALASTSSSDQSIPSLDITSTMLPSFGSTATPQTPPLVPIPGIEVGRIDQTSIDLLVQAGAYWVRRNALPWSAVEPQEGQRDWGAVVDLEREMQTAAERGLPVVLVVDSTPPWAQKVPGHSCGPILPDKIPAFANFLYEVVYRYSVPPYNVKYWEIWNEPDVDPSLVPVDSQYGCWGDQTDLFYGGGYYAEMLKQVYPQIKAADPDAQVLLGGLLLFCDPLNPPEGQDCTPSLFTEGILRSGGGDYFDGISFHAYDNYSGSFAYANPNWRSSSDSTGPVLIAKARYLRSLLASYQIPQKYLMNTEVGLVCGNVDNDPICQERDFPATKANYIAQVNAAALAEGLRANIWYSLNGWRGTGLLDEQGIPNRAFEVYGINTRQLSGAGFIRLVYEIAGVSGYELQRGDSRLMILWSLDGEDHQNRFDKAPDEIYNLYGDAIQPSQDVTISVQPLYLVWKQ